MTFPAPVILQCPQCAAILQFASDQTNMTICNSCGTVLRRMGDGTVQNSPQFIIINKTEIIQPGTTGKWKGKNFVVLGRFRAWFEEAVFNYWTIRFDDNTIAWLGEGYGIYSILMQSEAGIGVSLKQLLKTKTGETAKLLPPEKFLLEKKQMTHRWDMEGEIYIPAISSSFSVLDFSSVTGQNISLFSFSEEFTEIYISSYVSFEDLLLNTLRPFDNSNKKFNCTNCSKPVQVQTYPYAQSCACNSCGTVYALENGMDFKRVKLPEKETASTPLLPIGSTGVITNASYKVIGYAVKRENNVGHAKWREYTLYNPEQGFVFLSEFDGHWIYLKERCDSPVLANQHSKEFDYDKEPFVLFNSYNYEIVTARGEFPYNIFDNTKTKVKEFISPPEIWIQEKDAEEGITWFYGKHIAQVEIKKAFAIDRMPRASGIGAIQPTGYLSLSKIITVTIAGILLLLFTHVIIGMNKQERIIFDKTVYFSDTSDQLSVVTPKFTLNKRSSNLQLSISAPVSNSWFELGATLVNATTGKEYTVEQGVEYYAGFSEGEAWSEGSTQEDAYLTRIPAGSYFLELTGTREHGAMMIPSCTVIVTYDVTNHRNVWWALTLLLLWPVAKYLYVYQKERSRWNNSPYSIHS